MLDLKKEIKELCRNGLVVGTNHITKITGLVINVTTGETKEPYFSKEAVRFINNLFVREVQKEVVHYYVGNNYEYYNSLTTLEDFIIACLDKEKPNTKVQIIFPLLYIIIPLDELEEVFKDE